MIWRFKLCLGVAAVLLDVAVLAWSASAATGSAAIRVIDGDGLDLGGAKIRLWGIDAHELARTYESAPGRSTLAAKRRPEWWRTAGRSIIRHTAKGFTRRRNA